MNSLSEVSVLDFQQALDRASIRTSRILFFALAAGGALFSVAVFVISMQQKTAAYDDQMIPTVNVLSMVNLVFIMTSSLLGKFISDRQFDEKNLQRALQKDFTDQQGNALNLTPAQKCITVIRTASLIRLAIMEGSAFFGLAVMLIVVQSGIGSYNSLYYTNAVSIFPLFVYVVTNIPSAERIEEIFKRKIRKTSS